MKLWNKVVGVILAIPFFFIAGCAPYPQYCGVLFIENCTGTTITVQSNLICPRAEFPSTITYSPGARYSVAESLAYPEPSSITIDKFITNHDDAAITVTATINGVQVTKTWKYSERNNGQKQLFNLNDCYYGDGVDIRKNFTTMCYVFEIHEEDLK